MIITQLIVLFSLVKLECLAFSQPHKLSVWSRNKVNHKVTCRNTNKDDNGDDDLSIEAFERRKSSLQKPNEFDGYALRDIIYQKWGACFDVDFNRVDAMGFKNVYLNILPFRLGKRPFRHASEYDYLCHLQAVVEILQDYEQLDYVLYQISETKKKPRPGTSPLVAVPIRLDLTPEQVKSILRLN